MTTRFQDWIYDRGIGGDLELSFDELVALYDDIILSLPNYKIRVHEKYGPYCTCAYLMQRIKNSDGITLCYWDRDTENK